MFLNKGRYQLFKKRITPLHEVPLKKKNASGHALKDEALLVGPFTAFHLTYIHPEKLFC